MKQLLFFSFLFYTNALVAQSVVSNTDINVLYVGVDNPLTIIVQGVSPEALEVKISEGTITKTGTSAVAYIAKVGKAGKVKIETWYQGKKLEEIPFRVKKIPNPYAELFSVVSNRLVCKRTHFGSFSLAESGGLVAVLENFNFEAKCAITSYEVVHSIKNGEPVTLFNVGGNFTPQVKAEIAKSKPGDVIYLDKVKAKCPGDTESREINSKVYKIK